jgi:hypothetical protein
MVAYLQCQTHNMDDTRRNEGRHKRFNGEKAAKAERGE